MLLRLCKSPRDADVQPILDLAAELGYRTRVLDADRSLLELTRGPGTVDAAALASHRSRFEDLTAVRAVLDHADAPELVERAGASGDTVVRVGSAVFGGGAVSLVAGPCAVEDADDLFTVAQAVRDAGATLLRGGAFKPRTSPYSFPGLGEEGLERLAHVARAVDLPVLTEVLDPRDVERVARCADALQIGSRSMSNAALLRAAAESGLPILLKRGLAATAREFLLAAETVLSAGNPQVILCERGIRSFDTVTRNVLDLGTVAHLKRATHLPVVVDPSHAAGRAELVPPLAKAGLMAGADGLLLEVHHAPAGVHSDGAQALAPDAFAALARAVGALCALEGRTLHSATAHGGADTIPNQRTAPPPAGTPAH